MGIRKYLDLNPACETLWDTVSCEQVNSPDRFRWNDSSFCIRCFRFGRRVTLVVCTAVQVPISVLSAVVSNLVAFTVLRTILAAATAGQFNTAFIQGRMPLLRGGYVLNPNNRVSLNRRETQWIKRIEGISHLSLNWDQCQDPVLLVVW